MNHDPLGIVKNDGGWQPKTKKKSKNICFERWLDEVKFDRRMKEKADEKM